MSEQLSGGPETSPEISRRRVLAAAGATVGAVLLGPAASRVEAGSSLPGERAVPPFMAYHGVTGAGHQQRFDQLAPRGYRMISLSVYDRPARYAAVWVKRSGPAWVAVHGLSAAAYQSRFDELTDQGYVPVLVTATGSRNDPVFAAVFERISPAAWLARHGLLDGPEATPGTLAHAHRWARDHDCLPRTVAVYGSSTSDRTYAGVWLPNPTGTKWQHHAMGDGGDYQDWFEAYTDVPMRPALVDANDGLQYAGLFTDDSVGPWVARHGMTGAAYQSEFDTQLANGRMPIYVQGGGRGSSVRYAAVFAERDRPLPRVWTRRNAAGAGFTGAHDVMRSFMQTHAVRAGVLAVREDGQLRLSSGYTWAEPDHPVTQPASLMRLASVSKAFACAAIQALVDDDRLDLDDPVFPLLGITSAALPDQSPDSRIDTVTVRQCVAHSGGWVRGVSGFDPVFQGRRIARALGLPTRVTKRDVAEYMYGEPLQYDPGDTDAYDGGERYSNFGYVLLALVVEQVTGRTFQNYLKQRVLAPIGVADQVWTGATLRSGRRPTEVRYDAARVGDSAWDPWSAAKVPVCYGNFLIGQMDGGGGLIASARAVTRFIHHHAVWGLGGRAPNSARSGGMAGTASLAVSRGDGIDWCYIFNTADIPADRDADDKTALDRLAGDLNDAIDAM